jgi:hypothetical protein
MCYAQLEETMLDPREIPEIEEIDLERIETPLKTCGHAECACLMQEEETFCSDECEAASVDSAGCPCGHLACTSESAPIN